MVDFVCLPTRLVPHQKYTVGSLAPPGPAYRGYMPPVLMGIQYNLIV